MNFETLKLKIEGYKNTIATNKGRLSQIEESWLKNFGTSDVTTIQKILTDNIEKQNTLRSEYSQLMAEAEGICNELDGIAR